MLKLLFFVDVMLLVCMLFVKEYLKIGDNLDVLGKSYIIYNFNFFVNVE